MPRAGTYVLMVTEVTDPPFLGEKLPPLYVQVNVVARQKTPRHVSVEKLLRTKTQMKMTPKS